MLPGRVPGSQINSEALAQRAPAHPTGLELPWTKLMLATPSTLRSALEMLKPFGSVTVLIMNPSPAQRIAQSKATA